MFQVGDTVRIIGSGPEVWTITGSRGIEPYWQIQIGLDENTIDWKRTQELELVARAKKRDGRADQT